MTNQEARKELKEKFGYNSKKVSITLKGIFIKSLDVQAKKIERIAKELDLSIYIHRSICPQVVTMYSEELKNTLKVTNERDCTQINDFVFCSYKNGFTVMSKWNKQNETHKHIGRYPTHLVGLISEQMFLNS